MHVPQHITVAGDAGSNPRQRPLSMGDASGFAYQMNVPERILVAGGDEIRGGRAPPSEIMLDRIAVNYPTPELTTPPATLTLDKTSYPEIADESPPHKESTQSQLSTSMAVDENPLRELKLMRRQLGRLSTRLYQLEDDSERRKTRESLLWSYVLTVTGIFLYLFIKKRI